MKIYMKYGDLDGSATGRFKGWIEIKSVQLGGRLGRKRSLTDILVMKELDASSARLMNQSLNGKPVKVTFEFVDSNGVTCLRIILERVLITSFQTTPGSGGTSTVTEELSMSFTKMQTTWLRPSPGDKTLDFNVFPVDLKQ